MMAHPTSSSVPIIVVLVSFVLRGMDVKWITTAFVCPACKLLIYETSSYPPISIIPTIFTRRNVILWLAGKANTPVRTRKKIWPEAVLQIPGEHTIWSLPCEGHGFLFILDINHLIPGIRVHLNLRIVVNTTLILLCFELRGESNPEYQQVVHLMINASQSISIFRLPT